MVFFFVGSFGQLKPHIAILNLEGRGISESEATTLTGQLRGHLVNLGTFIVLDRHKMEDILKEQGFQQSGCTLTEYTVRAGRLLNVQKMVAGSIGKIGKTRAVNIFMIDVESGRIEKSFNRNAGGEIDSLLQILHDIARDFAGKKVVQADDLLGAERRGSFRQQQTARQNAALSQRDLWQQF
ncbi:MAG: penicillin-binding protein activator LpoB [candidate division KSB1 bacterium]|nr:penicillin-binding protein activator LpoB [candidate division KSB1 bacterium]MDZ7369484.1 penicillin-binding protein activator LpoB [candidate division KSB1 bacterium]MDZ7407585.1 penicillin-binding protein activator LpoB [candidate division KSB1 bacterium]